MLDVRNKIYARLVEHDRPMLHPARGSQGFIIALTFHQSCSSVGGHPYFERDAASLLYTDEYGVSPVDLLGVVRYA